MNRQITIGYATEGNSDVRFLESIIQRTFEDVAFECTGQVEVLPLQYIPKESGNFNVVVQNYAQKASQLGIMVLCIHTDADAENDADVTQNKIKPALESIETLPEVACKNIVMVIPVQMTESWMLADITLLKEEIGTDKTNVELKLHRPPETIADPKNTIKEAIRIARADQPKRRRYELTIDELYQPIGRKLKIEDLGNLPSFQKFRAAVKEAYRKLNYIYP